MTFKFLKNNNIIYIKFYRNSFIMNKLIINKIIK